MASCDNANFTDVALVLDDVLIATGLVCKHPEADFFNEFPKQLQSFLQTWYRNNPSYNDSDGDFVVLDAEVDEDSEEMSEAEESGNESE